MRPSELESSRITFPVRYSIKKNEADSSRRVNSWVLSVPTPLRQRPEFGSPEPEGRGRSKSQLQLHQFHRGRVRKTLKLGRGITPSAVRIDSRITLIGAPNARMGTCGSLARAGFPPSCEGGGGRRSTRAGGTEGAPNGWSGESQPKPERLGLPLGASSSSNKQNARKQNGKILQKLAVYQTYR